MSLASRSEDLVDPAGPTAASARAVAETPPPGVVPPGIVGVTPTGDPRIDGLLWANAWAGGYLTCSDMLGVEDYGPAGRRSAASGPSRPYR